MVKITYMPWKEIVLHEVREMEVPKFFELIVSMVEAQKQAGTPAIQWIDGIAFAIAPFPDTPEVVADKLNGKIHYSFVNFTKTSYQSEKKVPYGGRDHIVKLVKADDNPDFVELVKFLQNFKDEGSDGAKIQSP